MSSKWLMCLFVLFLTACVKPAVVPELEGKPRVIINQSMEVSPNEEEVKK